MNRWIALLIGVALGLVASIALMLVVAYAVLPLIDARDEMSRGLVSTLVLFFSAPLFAIIGGAIGHRRAVRTASQDESHN
ncbi:MAG: hypothetical protein ACO3IW_13875 [Burkholderiales bacterium]